MTAPEVVGSVLLISGALLAVLAGIGLLRLPDVAARLQGATKLQVTGFVLLAAGAAPLVPSLGEALKLIPVVLFQLVTAPVLAQLIGRAAHRAAVDDEDLVLRDDLRAVGPDAPQDADDAPAGQEAPTGPA